MATDNKYDRQLRCCASRLWGSNGQKALNDSHLLLLNASAAGTETLKNLVLPGVGHFTIADHRLVEERDLGQNFFVTVQDLGHPRAQAATRLLQELNPDVQGTALVQDPLSLIQRAVQGDLSFFQSFSLILASQLPQAAERQLSLVCSRLQIPVLLLKSVGLLIYLRVYAPEHQIVESKPADKEVLDLRLGKPFPELRNYASGFNLTELDDMAHGHVPYIVLLLQLLDQWKSSHGGSTPSSFPEKSEFKATIKAAARDYFKEMNFQEAVNNAYLCFGGDALPDTTVAILQDPKASKNNGTSSLFWTVSEAVAGFVNEHNEAPLSGSIPDMTATTEAYITLQGIYKAKSRTDLDWVSAKTAQILSRELTGEEIEYVSTYCKNVQHLELIRYRTLVEELTVPKTEDLNNDLEDGDPLVEWYVGLRAREVFYQREGRYPGDLGHDFKADAAILETDGKAVAQSLGLSEAVFSRNAALELARYGEAELHCLSAMLGGVASQEAVKLITKQFTPINNTFIYSAAKSKGVVYEL